MDKRRSPRRRSWNKPYEVSIAFDIVVILLLVLALIIG
jgi:hypothetical protein